MGEVADELQLYVGFLQRLMIDSHSTDTSQILCFLPVCIFKSRVSTCQMTVQTSKRPRKQWIALNPNLLLLDPHH